MKKGPKEVKMDENGNPIVPENKGEKLKKVGKKIVAGVGLVLGCVAAFVLVGLAMDSSDKSSDFADFGTDTDIPETSEENEESSDSENSESES